MESAVAPVIVTLEGKSRKAKNRIRDDGDKWMVLEIRETVGFSTEKGPWMLLAPLNGSLNNYRWIHETNDADFAIKK